jgi:hypothetical protein
MVLVFAGTGVEMSSDHECQIIGPVRCASTGQRHAESAMPHSFRGADSPVRSRPPVRLFGKAGIPGLQTKPVGGPVADPGVRPTPASGSEKNMWHYAESVRHDACGELTIVRVASLLSPPVPA